MGTPQRPYLPHRLFDVPRWDRPNRSEQQPFTVDDKPVIDDIPEPRHAAEHPQAKPTNRPAAPAEASASAAHNDEFVIRLDPTAESFSERLSRSIWNFSAEPITDVPGLAGSAGDGESAADVERTDYRTGAP